VTSKQIVLATENDGEPQQGGSLHGASVQKIPGGQARVQIEATRVVSRLETPVGGKCGHDAAVIREVWWFSKEPRSSVSRKLERGWSG